ncbi:MAG TPA: hypothetical protein VN687_19515 [Blastocatellia bacterium]|nr:hypothetical protein [Blastocatellia bacterium]
MERLTLRRNFRGEQIHLGPAQRWLDHLWDLRLGSVRGTIYKVALEAKAADRDDAVEISTSVYSTLQERLGSPTQQGDGIFLWDAADGNIVLQVANIGGDRRIMVFFTSSIARTFAVR